MPVTMLIKNHQLANVASSCSVEEFMKAVEKGAAVRLSD